MCMFIVCHCKTSFCCLKDEVCANIYPFKLISDREHGIVGSCSTYTTRKDITDDVCKGNGVLTLAAVHERLYCYTYYHTGLRTVLFLIRVGFWVFAFAC